MLGTLFVMIIDVAGYDISYNESLKLTFSIG